MLHTRGTEDNVHWIAYQNQVVCLKSCSALTHHMMSKNPLYWLPLDSIVTPRHKLKYYKSSSGDEILNSLIHRTLINVNIYGNNKLLKAVLLAHPAYTGWAKKPDCY